MKISDLPKPSRAWLKLEYLPFWVLAVLCLLSLFSRLAILL